MSDHGEKIVGLAQALLQSGSLDDSPTFLARRQAKEKSLALKAACLAALLSATPSTLDPQLAPQTVRPANRYERFEIEALLFYTARQLHLGEPALRQEVLTALKLSSFEDISALDYLRLRDYLWTRINEQ